MLQYDDAVTITLGTPAERAARVRALVSRVTDKPTDDSHTNVLARRAARLDAEVRNLVEIASRAGVIVPVSVTTALDAMYVSVQFEIATAQNRPGLYCANCSRLMTSVLDAVVTWTDGDVRELVHARGKGCEAREILERAS
jgi:phosphate uptake regulator